MQILLDAFLADCRCPIEMIGKVDNTQANTAAHKGYSKKLRFLERTHKCSIGTLHELVEFGSLRAVYAPTLTHRGDGCTKCLARAKLAAAREMMGLVPN